MIKYTEQGEISVGLFFFFFFFLFCVCSKRKKDLSFYRNGASSNFF